MKKIDKGELIALLIVCGLTVSLPLFITFYAPLGDAGMSLALLCFFAIAPVVSAAVGIYAGLAPRRRWYGPFLPAVIFLVSAMARFEWGEPAFFLYAGAYLVISAVSLLLTWLVSSLWRKRKKS